MKVIDCCSKDPRGKKYNWKTSYMLRSSEQWKAAIDLNSLDGDWVWNYNWYLIKLAICCLAKDWLTHVEHILRYSPHLPSFNGVK